MTTLTSSVISKITTAYKRINPSTLNGAIDVIVVQQEDGTLRCTPFHVRFGKLGVFQSLQNKVYITINDVPVEDICMQLGEAGEAVFIEENVSASINQSAHRFEPSDTNLFSNCDNEIVLSSEVNSHKNLSNIDLLPESTNEQFDGKELNQSHQPNEKFIDEAESKPTINIDVLHSDTFVSTRRRSKRRLFNHIDQFNKQASEDEDQDITKESSSLRHRSRVHKRDSTPSTANINRDLNTFSNDDDKLRSSIKILRKRSASENDIPLFEFDSGLTSFVIDQSTHFKSIDNQPKTLDLYEIDNNEEHFDIEVHENIDKKAAKSLSDPIRMEQTCEAVKLIKESATLDSSVLSKSAPSDTINTNNLISESVDPTDDFYRHDEYLPTTSYQSALSPRPLSPKSDTEYELEKSQQTPSVSWRWKWGELPQYLWPSSKNSKPKEGIYLDDITNNRCVDPSLYLPQLDYHRNQQRTTNDDDQESGTGNSIPQSPFREHETSCLLGDAQLSLCGNIRKQSLITDDVFNANLVSFETFVNNPSIIQDPNLVVRINGKYYNWNVASAIVTAASVFHKHLPAETIEQLQEKHMAQTKPRSTGGGWWLPFYSKRSDTKTEISKVITPVTATDVISTVAKSEIEPTLNTCRDFIANTEISKIPKTENDSEPEDSEVGNLTNKIEQERAQQQQQQQQQRSPSTHSSHQTTLKKTMLLSSDQLKRLNLKLGKNKVEFSVTTAIQGTTTVESNIFFFDRMTKFVISDIDGTITRSDVLGHIIPLVGGDWSHDGIAEFFNAVQENGYQFIYLSARAIGQSQITRNFLRNIRQSNRELPIGPLLVSPDTLMTALYREVIAKKPEDFKIECLKNIASLFPGKNPFYAGFGNRINDQWAYTAVGIPVTRIYTINPRGEVVRQKLSQALSTSYRNLHEIVDLLFPPMDSFSDSETYSGYTYWHEEPATDLFEDEMCAQLEEMSRQQKAAKSNTKNKGRRGTIASASVSGVLPTTTSTTTTMKLGNEKLLTLAQATENTIK